MSLALRVLFSLYGIIATIFIFIAFFADNESDGVYGEISRLLTAEIPNKFATIFQSLCGKTLSKKFKNFKNFLINEKNSVFQITYLFIINSAYLTWMIYGYPFLPTSMCSEIHNYISLIGVILSQLSFFHVCNSSPGIITPSKQNQFMNLPYDGLLYISNQKCKTCKIIKVT